MSCSAPFFFSGGAIARSFAIAASSAFAHSLGEPSPPSRREAIAKAVAASADLATSAGIVFRSRLTAATAESTGGRDRAASAVLCCRGFAARARLARRGLAAGLAGVRFLAGVAAILALRARGAGVALAARFAGFAGAFARGFAARGRGCAALAALWRRGFAAFAVIGDRRWLARRG
jgi:hypothetical protein